MSNDGKDEQQSLGALTSTHRGTTMKTGAIEVHDMLSVFSVDEVERRIGEVPGVRSRQGPPHMKPTKETR